MGKLTGKVLGACQTRYACSAKDRVSQALALQDALSQQRRMLCEQIDELPEHELSALEVAAQGKNPRKNDLVKAVASRLGVTVGLLLEEL